MSLLTIRVSKDCTDQTVMRPWLRAHVKAAKLAGLEKSE